MTTQNDSNFGDLPGSAKLTEREMAIAKQAARIAVQELTNEFYKSVGKNVVSKVLIWIGMLALGVGVAKGWITFTPPR